VIDDDEVAVAAVNIQQMQACYRRLSKRRSTNDIEQQFDGDLLHREQFEIHK
jgi:hypothetical protein